MDRRLISKIINCDENDIHVLTNSLGMTNSTQIVEINNVKYVIREPGVGSSELVNRENEYEAYETIKCYNLSDEVIYYDKLSGLKITKYVENSHTADINNSHDLIRILNKLKAFHSLKLTTSHEFDIIEKMLEYEKLFDGKSKYENYEDVKRRVMNLSTYIKNMNIPHFLTHIDPNVDNFLLTTDNVYLIDWEYAGMQDQDVDIAMMCIYSMLDIDKIDEIIDLYFSNTQTADRRYKIYAYCAMCGLLWSNWCEYKELLGETYPGYDIAQFNFADKYSKLALAYFEGKNHENN